MRNPLLLVLLAAGIAAHAAAGIPPAYWPKFPAPAEVHVTCDLHHLPAMHADDPGGAFGDLVFTLQSLAGLAARAVADGHGDAMLWLRQAQSASSERWLDETLRLTGAKRVDAPDPKALLQRFVDAGLAEGYIVYNRDTGGRRPYESLEDVDKYDNTVNVATTLAGLDQALIATPGLAPLLDGMGLRQLLDVRGRDEAWLFEHYRGQLRRDLVHIIDPKAPHLRAYAVASKSLCVFGVNPVTDQVFAWLEPNAPAFGWNAGDEYQMTSQMSRHAHFNTASNWIFNAPVLSTVRAGEDVPWEALQVNARATVNPITLDWPEQRTHFTAFVTSDGDNIQWSLGNFFDHPSYWRAERRAEFPIGWTAPVSHLSQLAPAALAYMAQTASPNDQIVTFPGGYFYPDEYGRETEAPLGALRARFEQVAGRVARLNVRVIIFLARDWDCAAARRAYALAAETFPGLAGMLAIQYHPYNGGLGEVLWTANADGTPIPVVSARYAIWAHLAHLENVGPPALVADRINRTQTPFADWTVVHTWSQFRAAEPGPDLLGEELPKNTPAPPDALGTVAAIHQCIKRLDEHVRVVSPEEMMWRLRLEHKPAATLNALAAGFAEQPLPRDMRERLKAYREWLADTALDTPGAARRAFLKLQAIRFGKAGQKPAR